jgi:hypothetical protein
MEKGKTMRKQWRTSAFWAAMVIASAAAYAGETAGSAAAPTKSDSGVEPASTADTSVAAAPAAGKAGGVKLDISGMTAIEEGRFVAGHHMGPSPGPMSYSTWIHRSYVRLRFDATIGSRLRIVIAPEVKLWSNTYPANLTGDHSSYPARQWSNVAIEEGQGIFSFGDPEKPRWQFSAGVIPYKYNPDAYNLGEYLFRSGAYPVYLITSFDYPYIRLSGFRVSANLWEHVKQDLLITTETQVMPLFDWSLSYLINYKPSSLFDAGAGVSLYRFYPVSDQITTPQLDENRYLNESGDVSYYTFKGIKLMGRASFDLKGILPKGFASSLKKEDGRIFAEAAVLGVKNYPAYVRAPDSSLTLDTSLNYYGKLAERIPVMFGINLPSFRFFDVFSVQVERFPWRYINSLLNQVYHGELPQPITTKGDITPADTKKGYLKWSVYAKKEVFTGMTIMAQLASDHTFHEYYYEVYRSDAEVFIKPGEMGWWLKIQYSF